jgi:hypothetical protein
LVGWLVIAKAVYPDLNRLSPFFDFDSIYTTQDLPVKTQFNFSMSIPQGGGFVLSEIVRETSAFAEVRQR